MKKILPVFVISAVVGLGVFFLIGQGTNKQEQDQTLKKQENISEPISESVTLKLPNQTVGQEADCSLYNLDELSKIWGVTLTKQTSSKVININAEGGKLYTCEYNETNYGMGLNFSIEYKEHASIEKAKNEMATIREVAKLNDQANLDQFYFENIVNESVGDEAFFYNTHSSNNPDRKNVIELLYVRKGNIVMLVSATNLDGVGLDYRENIIKSYKLHF
jgi:hypothetical protein